MKLLYTQEHLSCLNYEKGNRPVFQKQYLKKGEEWEMYPIDNIIVFVIEGALCFSFGEYQDRVILKNKMMLVPSANQFTSYAKDDTLLILIRLSETKQLCDCYSLDMLLLEKDVNFKSQLYYLDINERMSSFVTFLDVCVNDGLKCSFYLELKIKELFFLLRAYYPKKDLLGFFHLLLSKDISFSDLVLRNHYKAKTVQELAVILHYSLSGFQKRFKKVFGISAYRWMKDERSKSIYHEINNTKKSFKEISDDFGFSSPSYFNDFCKTSFGATPGRIRQNKALLNSKSFKKT